MMAIVPRLFRSVWPWMVLLLAGAGVPASAVVPFIVAEPVVSGAAEDWADGDEVATGSGRFVAVAPRPAAGAAAGSAPAAIQRAQGIARFGPFRVIDATHAALVDVTDERSPAAFRAMVAAYPHIRTLELVECPGTEEDRANLLLGRLIRNRGLITHVPSDGSVRSGAVELFLAGTERRIDPGAEFAVHAWADEDGHEPGDFPPNAPENRAYLDYYREMGMSPAQAVAFYAMTNSVPNASARWLTAAEMAAWVPSR